MAENGEKEVLGFAQHFCIAGHRFCLGLVDRLVEADHVLYVASGRYVNLRRPQAQHTRAKRPVFSHDLLTGEAGRHPVGRVDLGGSIVCRLRSESLGLGNTLVFTLRGIQIGSNDFQDGGRMIPSFFFVGIHEWFQRRGKILPLLQYVFEVGQNKAG
jgi:hypothetical protein